MTLRGSKNKYSPKEMHSPSLHKPSKPPLRLYRNTVNSRERESTKHSRIKYNEKIGKSLSHGHSKQSIKDKIKLINSKIQKRK